MKNFRIRAAAEPGEAEIYIYDYIDDWFGVSQREILSELKALGEISTIHLHISSGGGDVFQALTIYNMLRNHKARVVTHIDGLAASAAGVVAMAGDEVLMASNAFFMIHNPAGFEIGDSDDMRKFAALLDAVKDQLIAIYQRHSNLEAEELGRLMDEETWLNAEEAIAAGFATEITEELAVAASADRSRFRNAPESAKHLFNAPTGQKEDRMSKPTSPASPPKGQTANTPTAQQPPETPPVAAATPELDQEREALERERIAARKERLAARTERMTAKVDRDLEALGSRMTPGMLKGGIKNALVALAVAEEPPSVQVQIQNAAGETATADRSLYDVVLDTLKAVPEFQALGAGEIAGSDAEAGAPFATDRRTAEEKALHAKHGVTDDRFAEISNRYNLN